MSVPTQVVKLVEQFKDELQAVKSSKFKEDWVRRDYIDPFFKALGWDVDYERRGTKVFREVIVEDTLRVEGAIKAPDYCFYTEGTRRFFVEAKKPSVNLWDGRAAAFQVRRYAWSAKLPLSLLTDFEELAVYDCQIRPVKEDKASTARRLYMTYEEYTDRWDEIASLFSKEAVLSGSMDAFAQETKKKKGVATVDQEFLKEIEGWREMLAKDLAQRNPSLTRRELNYAVQMTIDRIVFLRICEDRGIEDYGNLEGLLGKNNVYDVLRDTFRNADDKYNSGLFHFKREKDREELPDDLTLNLELSDEPLKKIVKGLYYPESPYQFSVMPVEILGQVYEQFLGKVINLTPDHRATVEEKPEVRKAGGVYYTPSYIVEYIVKNTVGKLIEGKTPRQVSKLKILDPSCGSGSFLVGAYSYLLEWHREQYVNDGPDKHSKILYEGPGGEWQLTTAEKKRILLNNIYGVDLDSQAVEVTKLSLLLKVLEGETNETINSQLTFFQERALPDLDNNIKWGNSLIGWDFYDKAEMSLLNEEENYRINVFDWKEAFPGVFEGNNPGFDTVIGNPPYIRIQALKEWSPIEVEHYKEAFRSAGKGNYDIYVVFVEKGLSLLNKNGRLGYILPSKFLSTDYGASLRTILSESETVARVVDFGHDQVFEGATTYTCLLFLDQTQQKEVEYLRASPNHLSDLSEWVKLIPAWSLGSDPWLFADEQMQTLLIRLQKLSVPLLELPASMSRGTSTGADDVFCLLNVDGKLTTRSGDIVEVEEELLRQPLYATDFTRYFFRPKNNERIIFPYIVSAKGYDLIEEAELQSRWPKAYEYLSKNREKLEKRKQYRLWYGFSAPRNLSVHDHADLLVPLLANRGLFAPMSVNGEHFCVMASGGFSVRLLPAESPVSPLYVLGLVNSKLLFWNLRIISNKFRGGWITCTKQYFGTLPIRVINFSNPTDKDNHDRMVGLVEQMLTLHEQLSTARTANDKNFLQRQINATDRQIDRLVYELYELTEEEIKIIEG